MSSITYTLSQFTHICKATPAEALAIIMSDVWFETNISNPDVNRYIKFTIQNNKITFVKRLNIIISDNSMFDDYVKVDKTIKINELTLDTPLTQEELASIVFKEAIYYLDCGNDLCADWLALQTACLFLAKNCVALCVSIACMLAM
jgi:hypothetical protein